MHTNPRVFLLISILDFQVSGFCVIICAQALNKCSIPHAKWYKSVHFDRLWASMRIAKIEISNTPNTHTQTIITKLEISHFWNFVSVFSSSSSCAFAVRFPFFLSIFFVATPSDTIRNISDLFWQDARSHFRYRAQIYVHASHLFRILNVCEH